MQKKVIIHIINNLHIGGAETLLVNTIPLLSQYEHILVCLSDQGLLKNEILSYLRSYHVLDVKGKHTWVKAIFKLRRIIESNKPLLVHSHLQLSTLLTRVACPGSTPLVFTIHSTYSQDAFRNNKLALSLERLTVKKRHFLIGVSNFVIEDYLSFVPFKGQTFVLYNFVSEKFFTAGENSIAPKKPGPNLKLVAVGSLKEAKNYSYLIEAFRHLKDYPVELDIYGEGPERGELEKKINTYEVNVKLRGVSMNIEKVLTDYDAYVICSKHEGYGIAPLEAMAAGLPVLASSIAVFKEVIGEQNALFFDLADPRYLARLVMQLAKDEDNINDMAARGRQRAVAIASKEIYKEQLNKIYSTIIG